MIILKIIYMHSMLLIISSLIFITMNIGEDRYSQYKIIQNVQSYTKVAYSSDKTKLIFYGETSNKIDVYCGYDYKLLRAADTTTLMSAPTALHYFEIKKGMNAIIYGNKNNEVVIYSQTDNQQRIVLQLPSEITKIEVSRDNKIFAVVCEGDTKVYSGSTQVGGERVLTTLYDFKTNISQIKWRPRTNQLTIAGGNHGENKNKIVLINLDNQILTNLSGFFKFPCQDIQFSADGLKMAYIQNNQGNYQQQYVKIIDLQTKQTTDLVAADASKLLELKRYGNLLTAYDLANSYVWKFDQIYLGKQPSSLKSAGISPDGQEIISRSLDRKKFIIYTLCADVTTFYKDSEDACVPCSNPCKACFFSSTQCTSCINQFYFQPLTLKCSACLKFCQTCKDEKTCENCLDRYYKVNNTCKLCEASIEGCKSCTNGKTCQICDTDNNWIKNQDGTCSCDNKFVKVGNKCLNCPSHCLTCSTTDTCNICDATEHRKVEPFEGQCLCENGYFQNSQQKCELCMTGCADCHEIDVCQQCDSSRNWVLNNSTCVCNEAYIEKNLSCIACSSIIDGCDICDTFTSCTSCSSNYVLNTQTHACDKAITETNILVVILVGAAIVSGIAVGAYFLYKIIKKRRSRKVVQTLIQKNEDDSQINTIQ